MARRLNNFFKQLPLLYHSCYIAEKSEEKLSGGFFRGTQLLTSPSRKYVHDYFAFVYLLEGRGLFTDSFKVSHDLLPGSLFFRFPNKPYSIKINDYKKWLEFAVAVPNSLFKGLLTAKIFDENITFLQTELSVEILEKGINFINSLAVSGQSIDTAFSYSALLDLLTSLLSAHQRRGRNKDSLEQAKLLLGNNLHKRMNIPAEIAKLGMGYESFRKRFSAEYGISPKAYRIARRLDKANVLLVHTGLSIKEIADSLGYPGASDFIRQYRKIRNVSPGEFRKSNFL